MPYQHNKYGLCICFSITWSLVFSGYSGFLHQYIRPLRYNSNIVEGGSKHHNPNPLKWYSAGPSIPRLQIFIFITCHAYYVYIWIKHLLKQYWCCWTGENLSYHTTNWSGCLYLQRYNALFYFGAISLWCVVSVYSTSLKLYFAQTG